MGQRTARETPRVISRYKPCVQVTIRKERHGDSNLVMLCVIMSFETGRHTLVVETGGDESLAVSFPSQDQKNTSYLGE